MTRRKWSWTIAWPAALLACSDTHGSELEDDSGSVQPLCTRDRLYFPVQAANLKPTEDFDYIAIRYANAADASMTGEAWTRTDFTTRSETGDACNTATSSTCMDTVAHHPVPFVSTYCVQFCIEWSVVTTRGDTVTRWVQPEQVLSLLGNIDAPDEALMVVASNGYSVECPSRDIPGYPEEAVPQIKAVDDGFEVIATRPVETCPVVLRRFRLHVRANGEIDELDTRDLPWKVCA